jgi:hypothetical protein
MTRYKWLRGRDDRLWTMSERELRQDISYCEARAKLAKLKSHKKTWAKRRLEAEKALMERFGETSKD